MAIAALCGLQLWLSFPDEIAAQAGPYDQIRYLEMAESIVAGRWLGPFDVMTLARDVGYALWIAAVHGTGVPLRIASELLSLAAGLLLCLALIRCEIGRGVAVGIFAVLALQPHGFVVARDLQPAGFYGALLAAALAGMLFAITARSRNARLAHLGWTALALGMLWITRPERAMLGLALLAFAACDIALARQRGATPTRALARSIGASMVLAVGIGLVAGSVSGLNYLHYSVFRLTDYEAPGFLAANRRLLSIRQSRPRRVVPVPAEVRRLAYAASPAFAALATHLEGPSWARGVSCNLDHVCDDIGAGYFRWIFREAVAEQISEPSATSLDAAFARIADELAQACEDGRLPCRGAPSSFLHPYPETYLSHLPSSLGSVLARMASSGGARDREPARDPPDLPPELRARFDAIANRRARLTHLPVDRFVVWATADSDAIVAAHLDVGGNRSGLRLEADPERAGLRIRFEVERHPSRSLSRYPVLEFARVSGAVTLIPAPLLGDPVRVDGVSLETEQWEPGSPVDRLQNRVRGWLWSVHATLVVVAGGSGAVALLWLTIAGPRRVDAEAAAIVLIGGVVASRIALLATIDASSFPASSSRYVYPVVSLFSVVSILLVRRAWRAGRGRRIAQLGSR